MNEVIKNLWHLLTHSALENGDSVKGKSFIWCSGGVSSSAELKPRASRDKYHLYEALLLDFFFPQHLVVCASAGAAGDGALSGFVKSTVSLVL